jgi:hypothetical protein
MTKPEIYSLMVTTNLSIKMLKLYTKTLDIIFEITGTQLVLNTFELNSSVPLISNITASVLVYNFNIFILKFVVTI